MRVVRVKVRVRICSGYVLRVLYDVHARVGVEASGAAPQVRHCVCLDLIIGLLQDKIDKELTKLVDEHAKCEPEKRLLQREKVPPHTGARDRARYDYQKSANDVYSLRHPSRDTLRKFQSNIQAVTF